MKLINIDADDLQSSIVCEDNMKRRGTERGLKTKLVAGEYPIM